MPLVASLYLSAADYRELVEVLATSSYAHISEAAVKCPTVADARFNVQA